jgi:hypothetical protein
LLAINLALLIVGEIAAVRDALLLVLLALLDAALLSGGDSGDARDQSRCQFRRAALKSPHVNRV